MNNYTHIKFTKIGSKVNLLVNGVAAVVNQKYLVNASSGSELKQQISTTFSINKKNSSDVGTPYDTLKYKAYKGDLESNEATIQVDLLTKTDLPAGSTSTVSIPQNSNINLSSYISINSSSDRIIIENYDYNSGQLTLNSQVVNPGSIIMKEDIQNLIFKSFSGTGIPYQKIIYRAANSITQAVNSNTIQLNIAGNASLLLTSYTVEQIESVLERFLSAKISNGRINKKAKFSININLDAEKAWPIGNKNEIILASNNFNKRYTSNINEEIEVSIDQYGESDIQMNMTFIQPDISDITGNIEIKLLSVDGDSSIVTSNNTININFTTTP